MALNNAPFSQSRLLILVLSIVICVSLTALATKPVTADKDPKPEEVAEKTIQAYGTRAALYGVQRNGVVRALVKFFTPQGVSEGKSATKFIRKQKMSEDLMMIDLELPGTRYLIGFDGQAMWSIHDGETQKPSDEAIKLFRGGQEHSYDALLRYKENNAKLEYVSGTKLGTIDLDIIDLISPTGARTRYEISRRTYHILYLSYEDKPDEKSEPVKYRLNFKTFRVIQNTLVPYEIQVFQNGKLVEERKVVEAAFNVQLDEKAFKAENAIKPAEASPGL